MGFEKCNVHQYKVAYDSFNLSVELSCSGREGFLLLVSDAEVFYASTFEAGFLRTSQCLWCSFVTTAAMLIVGTMRNL
uniref:Uncharacterized protein n=1 Tax=Parascaris univalens TaxID=6257 RepID=A0A915A0F3_PARUN